MYTENNNKSLKTVFFKIILVVLFIFVLMLLFPTKGFMTNYIDKKTMQNDNFNSNIIAMATAGSGYFTGSRLPKNVGDKEKLTLKEIYDKKMMVRFTDSNGITCSTKKSYVEVTKEEEEYTMKVNLSCSDKTDYIMLHMGLDGTQFPSTSTARCTFVKNLDEAWVYGEWSSWSTKKIQENGTNQVQTSSKQVKIGEEVVEEEQIITNDATKFIYNGVQTYYVCGSNYDNKGVYNIPTTCIKKTITYNTKPVYATVTYYRSRSKKLSEKSQITKEANCDDDLSNEGYIKLS